MTRYYFTLPSPIGTWAVHYTAKGLWAIDYEPDLPGKAPAGLLAEQAYGVFAAYFNTARDTGLTRLPLDLTGVPEFQARVLTALQTLPLGQVRHYAWLAEAAGSPRAFQAVGQALGGNPLPIVIPCHRIVSKTGALGGFMKGHPQGPRIKTFLLALEGHTIAQGWVVGVDDNVKSGTSPKR